MIVNPCVIYSQGSSKGIRKVPALYEASYMAHFNYAYQKGEGDNENRSLIRCVTIEA